MPASGTRIASFERNLIMQARELVELSAMVSAQGPALVRQAPRLSSSALEEYWTASKIRLDRWSHALRDYAAEAGSPANFMPPWPALKGVAEEILTGEILARVWSLILCAHDRTHQHCEAEPIARSVLLGHLETRHRALTFLLRPGVLDIPDILQINQFRCRCERWTDLLVGYLSGLYPIGEFAVDPRRAGDFARDLNYQNHSASGRQAWPVVLSSLQSAFREGLVPESPNADLNARIAAAVLAVFPAELFDSTGLYHSLWLTRLMNAAQDAQGMIDELMRNRPGRTS
jgi:hypothetical protein